MREAVGAQEEAGGLLVKARRHPEHGVVQDLQGVDADAAGREASARAPGKATGGLCPSPLPALTCESTEKLATTLSLSRTGCT